MQLRNLVFFLSMFLPAIGFGQAGGLVPGTGARVANVGDDFEAEDWSYTHNDPKSSHEIDDRMRLPGGRSKNGRLVESAKRGHPDRIVRVTTPPGGIPDSTGALLLMTRRSGVPTHISRKMEQDDLLINARGAYRGTIPVSWSPSCVVRIYVPPFEQWERRAGTSFGFRADCQGTKGWKGELEPYWPGMFIQLLPKTGRKGREEDLAQILVRAGSSGRDFRGPQITQPGWWTLGMSFTADGRVHFYASEGVDNLTAEDHLSTQYPYGFKCRQYHTFFFNVANRDDGRTWSTPWVIDDPELYWNRPFRTQSAAVKRQRR